MKSFPILLTTATFAFSTAMVSAEPMIFVPEGSANAVRMVDAVTGETLKRITGVEAVHGLSGAVGVPYLVAGSYAETDRAEIAPMEQPEGMSDDAHVVHHMKPTDTSIGPANAGISILTILDAGTGDIVKKIEVPGAVHHTAVSPDGRFAVATHPSGDGISVIDLETLALAAFVPTGTMPSYAAFGADSNVVYVSNAGNGTISEVNLDRGIVTRNLLAGAGPEHIVIDADNAVLFAADADAGNVIEISLKDGATTRTFPIGGELHGLDLSQDRANLFVAGRGEDKIGSVTLATGAVSFASLAPEPYHLTSIPGTGTFAVSSRAEPTVWIIDQATMEPIKTVAIEGEGHQMVAFP